MSLHILNIASALYNSRFYRLAFGQTQSSFWGAVLITCFFSSLAFSSLAQGDTKASARLDARQITIGDQARLFIEVQHNPAAGRLQWAAVPDTFSKLEVVEKGKIDTIKQGNNVIYKQRLLITGFDSGVFHIQPLVFSVIPNSGTPYTALTDSFDLLVQTVPVDTTKGFKGIKGIIYVKSSWLDNIWIIIAVVVSIVLAVFVILYFIRNKKTTVKAAAPSESLTDFTLRLLNELDKQTLWQKNQVKEYYVQLTDIVRNYIETRFHESAMELTTDELLAKVQLNKEMIPHYALLDQILHTADLAKFAKFQPSPQEHIDAMDKAKQFVMNSKPVVIAAENTNAEQAQPEPKKDNTPPIE